MTHNQLLILVSAISFWGLMITCMVAHVGNLVCGELRKLGDRQEATAEWAVRELGDRQEDAANHILRGMGLGNRGRDLGEEP